jgi:hypothetical protein
VRCKIILMTGLARTIPRVIEPTTSRRNQRQHDQANDSTTEPTTAPRSQRQHDGANDKTTEPTTKRPSHDSTTELTTAQQSQRQHDRANDNAHEIYIHLRLRHDGGLDFRDSIKALYLTETNQLPPSKSRATSLLRHGPPSYLGRDWVG